MAPFGKSAATVGVGQPSFRLVLLDGDTCSISVCIGVPGAAVNGDDDGEEYPCGFPTPYHRETGKMANQRVMGDTGV